MPVSDYMGINWFLSSQTSINLLIYNRLNTAYLCKFDQQCRISLHINMAVDGAHCTLWWDESSDLALQVIALLQVSSHCAGCAHPPRKLINVTSYIIYQFMINDLTCHPSSLSYFCSNEAWKYTETLWIEILLYPKEQSWMNPTHTTWSCKWWRTTKKWRVHIQTQLVQKIAVRKISPEVESSHPAKFLLLLQTNSFCGCIVASIINLKFFLRLQLIQINGCPHKSFVTFKNKNSILEVWQKFWFVEPPMIFILVSNQCSAELFPGNWPNSMDKVNLTRIRDDSQSSMIGFLTNETRRLGNWSP